MKTVATEARGIARSMGAQGLMWFVIRVAMEWGVVRAWWRGYSWRDARRLIAEETALVMRRIDDEKKAGR